MKMQITDTTATTAQLLQPRPEKLPVCHLSICLYFSPARFAIMFTMALMKSDSTIPVRTMVLLSKFLSMREVNATAANMVRRANTRPAAARVNCPRNVNPAAITSPAPNEAPLETPRV